MASTARDEDDKKEYFDSPEELDKKVSQLAEWIRESKHMIVFTVSFIRLKLIEAWPIIYYPTPPPRP